jgi:pimeloyl-ACP methyl ester carboxylesterase
VADAPAFVLVHGGRHGGWCWQRVSRALGQAGCAVYSPTLTGLGERAHLLSRDIGLPTHIADVTGVFDYEDLEDVILVAHSYGGFPAAGAMESVHERVRRLVLLDAHLPRSGQSVFDLIGADRAAVMMSACERDGEGWYLPVSDSSYWGVSDTADVAWVNRRVSPQPIRTYQDPLPSAERARAHASAYIECAASTLPGADLEWHRRRSLVGQRHQFRVLDAPHDAMITHPRQVADMLLEIAFASG